MKDQTPLTFAVTVPNRVVPSKILTDALASAVPLITSTVSLVTPPSATRPMTGFVSSVTALMTGATGTRVSKVSAVKLAAAPLLPAASA